jgi:diguanylate cyclase (GGDEF)-like protein
MGAEAWMRPRTAGALSAQSAWWQYLLLAGAVMVISPLLAASPWGQTAVLSTLGLAAAALCAWRSRHSVLAAPWLWIAVGLALNASGSVAEAIQTQVLKSTAEPSVADILYLAMYPCVTVGLLLRVRARYPNAGLAKLLDAGMLATGMGLLCWVFLIAPRASGAAGSPFAQAVNVAFPVGDLMLLTIIARVLVSEGWRSHLVRLLTLALLAFLLGDSGWALVNQKGWTLTPTTEALLGEPFLLAFALFGAAALHRSASQPDAPAEVPDERVSTSLMVCLALAGLVAPGLLAGEALSGQVGDGIAIAVAAALLAALVVVRMSALLRSVQRQSVRLRELALEDSLTGLPNRRALQGRLSGELARARRDHQPLSLALVDLDNFKLFNDRNGHPAGDQLLKSAAAAWSQQLRAGDMLARVGGEEFVLVLAGADADRAAAIVEKLRASTPFGQSFSAGVVQWDSVALPEEMLQLADAAMYEAKRAGRNRTALARAPVRMPAPAVADAAFARLAY